MAANELEVLLTAAMLLALPVIAMCYWRDNRAISWGALGLCLLIPEAASERPNGALLHSIMAITAVIVVLQLYIDALKQRQEAHEPAEEAADFAALADDAQHEALPARDDTLAAPPAWNPGYRGTPQPPAHALHFLQRKHTSSPAPGAPWQEAHGSREGQRP